MKDHGRSDYGPKKKGQIDVPAEKGNRGMMGLSGNSSEMKKGGPDVPSQMGDKGKSAMSKKGPNSSDKRAHIIGG